MHIVLKKLSSEHKLENITEGSLVLINNQPFYVTDLYTKDLTNYCPDDNLPDRLCLDQNGLRHSFGKEIIVELIADSNKVIITTKE